MLLALNFAHVDFVNILKISSNILLTFPDLRSLICHYLGLVFWSQWGSNYFHVTNTCIV